MIKYFKPLVSLNKKNGILIFLISFLGFSITTTNAQNRRFMRKPVAGEPTGIQITPYKTTMIADGKDTALIKVAIIDGFGNEVPGAKEALSFHIQGDAHILSINGDSGADIPHSDTLWNVPVMGSCRVILQTGRTRSVVKLEVKSDTLYAGSTEIHTVQPGTPHPVTEAQYVPRMVKDKILGADISFLPELESHGMKFSDNGVPGDPIKIMRAHGFNYIRLRIFVDPANPKGYSPGKGFCDLAHTMAMAKRIKAAGMKFLLDFHYSDYWADPQQQNKPLAWVGESFPELTKSLHDYTVKVMTALKDQGTTPDMVQIGNEINHGILWPDGEINNLDSLARLIYAGVTGVREVSPSTIIMLHIALGGQNAEARFFVDNMLARHVPFDVIGLSYYPRWHGTPEDLRANMTDLAKRYKQQVMVAEYSQLKKEVNDIAFTAPGKKALGTFIWEPLSSWEGIFDKDGKANQYMNVYPVIAKEYGVK